MADEGAYTELPEYCTISSLLPVERYPFSETVPLTDAPVPPVGSVNEPRIFPEVKKVTVPVGGPPAVVPVTVKLTVAAVE